MSHIASARMFVTALGLACVLSMAGCASPDTQEPAPPPQVATESVSPTLTTDPAQLWNQLETAAYTSWDSAPGFEEQQPSTGPHGDSVRIFVNDTVAAALTDPAQAAWPSGSIIVKDVYTGDALTHIAVMQKTTTGWYWAEYDATGSVLAQGLATPSCQTCHDEGSDGVRSFSLPE